MDEVKLVRCQGLAVNYLESVIPLNLTHFDLDRRRLFSGFKVIVDGDDDGDVDSDLTF